MKSATTELCTNIYNFLKTGEKTSREISKKFGLSNNALKCVLTHMGKDQLIYEDYIVEHKITVYGIFEL